MVAELSLIRWWLDNLATDSILLYVCMFVRKERPREKCINSNLNSIR